MTRAKSSGARGHPCLTALCISTFGVIQPGVLVFMANFVPRRDFMTKSMKSCPMWILLRARSMLVQGRQS